MISPKEALEIILAEVRACKTEIVPLKEAAGRRLARDVRADRDSPPTDISLKDGYAVRSADLAEFPAQLRLAGEVAAGSPGRRKVRPGACLRILTGAPVPPGADAVVMVEKTREDPDGTVTFAESVPAGADIRGKGEAFAAGDAALQKGALLTPSRIGICATVGKTRPRVYRKPRVSVVRTGSELKSPSSRVARHQHRDYNGPALFAALDDAGYPYDDAGIIPDDPAVLAAELKKAAREHDIVIVTGGLAVGKYDYVPDAVKRLRAKVHYYGIAMRPGKHQLFASLGGNRHIFGLPGNPLAALTGFYEFVIPALKTMSGCGEASRPLPLILETTGPVRSRMPVASFVPARIVRGAKLRVEPVKWRGAADLAAAAEADGTIVKPAGGGASAGEMVEFHPWKALL